MPVHVEECTTYIYISSLCSPRRCSQSSKPSHYVRRPPSFGSPAALVSASRGPVVVVGPFALRAAICCDMRRCEAGFGRLYFRLELCVGARWEVERGMVGVEDAALGELLGMRSGGWPWGGLGRARSCVPEVGGGGKGRGRKAMF